jgi:hypothetical protein
VKVPENVVLAVRLELDNWSSADKLAWESACQIAYDAGRKAEREEIAPMAKTAWLTSSHGIIGDADYGEALCAELEAAIRARGEGESA